MKTLITILLCLFLPPIAVFLKDGVGWHLLINIVLMLLTVGVGAVIHAFWVTYRDAA